MKQGPDLDILVLNRGSSSLKFGLFKVGRSRIEGLLTGEVASIGKADGAFSAKDASGRAVSETTHFIDQRHAINHVVKLLKDWNFTPAAIGHRIVHGGPKLRQPCMIDDRILERLESAAPFAPLHIPEALEVIHAATALFPDTPQAACFDTTFHTSMPDVARTLPIPREWEAQGIHRYGFHGLSCESIVRQLGEEPPERLIIAHLGAGASVTAVRGGRSVDTSMGLTPTGGVMMGTRSGDLDPGVLLYLMRHSRLDAQALEDLVDRRSGLFGISGVSSDMRDLRAVALVDPDAALAIDMFGYQIRKQIGAMAAVLGGVDTLVFTGGIGENDALLRIEICDGLGHLGVALNQTTSDRIDMAASGCCVAVLHSRENEQIARHTRTLMDVSGL